MNILFITPSYKPAWVYGGPTVSVSELAEALASLGHNLTVYTTTANGREELDVQPGVAQWINGVKVIYFKRITGDHTHVAPALWRAVRRSSNQFDIIHLHSWWSLLIMGAAWILARKGQQFILSPRGMLGEYSFRHQHSHMKQLVHEGFGKTVLKKSILHATSLLEWNDCRRVNRDWDGFILPNLVDLPEVVAEGERERDIFTLGFLSRIDPKKGLEFVFNALSKVDFDFRFRIAGAGDEAYIAYLRSLADTCGIADKIEWCGWMKGIEKFRFLSGLDLFILTSHNENFALAVIESLAMGSPVLVSENVGLADYVNEKQLGWTCKTEVTSVHEQLLRSYGDKEQTQRIRKTAPETIAFDFDKKRLALLYESQYDQLRPREKNKIPLKALV